jgi:ABC-type sugar transport system substrate-binding protein
MKRIAIVLLVGIMLLCACACGQRREEEAPAQPSGTPVPTAGPVPEEPPVALVLAGENEYTQTVAAAARPLAEAEGYGLSVYYSADAGAQLDDMYAAIGGGAKCIILMPIDMDNLQPVLDECDLLKLPVVNIMVPVNGLVRVLISPDYQFMGAQAAEAVDGLSLPDAANVLTIEALDSPFVTQLVHDGFHTASRELDNVTLAASVLAAGGDVYRKTKDALAEDETLNCVFVIDEYLTPDAIRAVREAGRPVAVIAMGGGVEMQAAVEGGSAAASVFSSPYELAELACAYALMAANGGDTAIPQYAGLRTEIMDGQTIAQYKSTGYADVMLPPQQAKTEEDETERNETEESEQDEGEAVDE